MKFSRYTIITEVEGEYILYNSIYSSMVLLTFDELELLKQDIKNNTDKSNLITEMENQNIIVKNTIDEEEELYRVSDKLRFQPEQITFTIAPTMNCNFDCPYCYEKGFRCFTMNDEVAEKVAYFILDNISKNQTLKIIWYGGEPLMGMKAIKIISEIIISNNERYKEFIAEIVTNGYYLTKNTANLLKSLHINYAQVTLDGDKETHDSRRCLIDGTPTFEKILKNIQNSIDFIPITIRVNIDKNNSSEQVLKLMEILNDNNLLNKVGFYLAPVEEFDDVVNPSCLTPREFSVEELTIYKKLFNQGLNITKIPRTTLGFCEAINRDDYIIDQNGFLYKCWVHIGKQVGRVGDIFNGIDNNIFHKKFTSFTLMDDSKCRNCKVQPLCLGGCPLIKMNTGHSKCVSLKYNISDQLQIVKKVTE
ncbi:SPASM domain-containing protein [Streptococcus suis]|uniref:radical SAM/SPASM domain-containing protein n=1 Tax=Streptococcus suis TaxID=1307 RepID=UPI00201A7D22|nr:radical SAM protein [Streptococcus suis]MCL4908797.1 SPASM domain-containing protein [Streptococcus suis]